MALGHHQVISVFDHANKVAATRRDGNRESSGSATIGLVFRLPGDGFIGSIIDRQAGRAIAVSRLKKLRKVRTPQSTVPANSRAR